MLHKQGFRREREVFRDPPQSKFWPRCTNVWALQAGGGDGSGFGGYGLSQHMRSLRPKGKMRKSSVMPPLLIPFINSKRYGAYPAILGYAGVPQPLAPRFLREPMRGSMICCVRSGDDIDDALRAWNGNIEQTRAVVRYMQQHGRERNRRMACSRSITAAKGSNLHYRPLKGAPAEPPN